MLFTRKKHKRTENTTKAFYDGLDGKSRKNMTLNERKSYLDGKRIAKTKDYKLAKKYTAFQNSCYPDDNYHPYENYRDMQINESFKKAIYRNYDKKGR